jgi:hypothetical protein
MNTWQEGMKQNGQVKYCLANENQDFSGLIASLRAQMEKEQTTGTNTAIKTETKQAAAAAPPPIFFPHYQLVGFPPHCTGHWAPN